MRAGAGIANFSVQRVTVRAPSVPLSAAAVLSCKHPCSPLPLRTILFKSTLVHVAPLRGIGAARAGSLLIPVALGPGRAFEPLWKTFGCGGCPDELRGLEGAVGNGAVFLPFFSPPICNPLPIHHCLCKPPGDKGKGEKLKLLLSEEVAAEGGRVRRQLCTPPAPLWGCWRSTRGRGAGLGQ